MDPRLAAYIRALPETRSGTADPLAGTVAPDIPFRKQLRAAGLFWRLSGLVSSRILETGLLLASWVFIGYGALNGRLDVGWLAAWALCLATTVPLRLTGRWLEGVIAAGAGALLRQRLLAGAIRMDADAMRRKGAGELMAEILESEATEQLASGGGFESVLAALELMVAPVAFLWGAARAPEIGVLALWCVLVIVLCVAHSRRRSAWTRLRLRLTHRLVENMSAHRTRLVQQQPAHWHRDEDRELQQYAEASERLDPSTAVLEAAVARGYAIAGLAALAPSFFGGTATHAQEAITLGAILLAASALERLAFGIPRGAAAWIAGRMMKPIFDAGSRSPEGRIAADVPPALHNVLQVREVFFTHQGRPEPVLRNCSVSIKRGDLLLLEGDSGSGKSTLAALVAGLRKPSSGVILTGGLDRQTLGEEAWRRRIAAAPQYHENHILSASFAFNLLLGRPYPHTLADVQEARKLCMELGLGPLLERMPAGMEQIVGETGWQLSQGERSRVFLARALLQGSEMVILDESLAALDPENLQRCLECVMRRAVTLLVVAHP
jgi:ATP-binding cassette, subfamily B, bacterial